MPEGRMLKKRICESKGLGSLNSDSARLLYTWLIPWLDIEGRHSADPEIIKGHIFPKIKTLTISKIKKLLIELHNKELIVLYVHNGETYLQFIKFTEHQILNPDRESPSKIPPPPENSRELQRTPENSMLSKDKLSLREEKLREENIHFDSFWNIYPKKVEKQVARKAWDRLMRTTTAKPEEVITAAKSYTDHLTAKGETKYIKNPSTFLNEGRWKDWLPGSEAQKGFINTDPFWSKP